MATCRSPQQPRLLVQHWPEPQTTTLSRQVAQSALPHHREQNPWGTRALRSGRCGKMHSPTRLQYRLRKHRWQRTVGPRRLRPPMPQDSQPRSAGLRQNAMLRRQALHRSAGDTRQRTWHPQCRARRDIHRATHHLSGACVTCSKAERACKRRASSRTVFRSAPRVPGKPLRYASTPAGGLRLRIRFSKQLRPAGRVPLCRPASMRLLTRALRPETRRRRKRPARDLSIHTDRRGCPPQVGGRPWRRRRRRLRRSQQSPLVSHSERQQAPARPLQRLRPHRGGITAAATARAPRLRQTRSHSWPAHLPRHLMGHLLHSPSARRLRPAGTHRRRACGSQGAARQAHSHRPRSARCQTWHLTQTLRVSSLPVLRRVLIRKQRTL